MVDDGWYDRRASVTGSLEPPIREDAKEFIVVGYPYTWALLASWRLPTILRTLSLDLVSPAEDGSHDQYGWRFARWTFGAR